MTINTWDQVQQQMLAISVRALEELELRMGVLEPGDHRMCLEYILAAHLKGQFAPPAAIDRSVLAKDVTGRISRAIATLFSIQKSQIMSEHDLQQLEQLIKEIENGQKGGGSKA